jgi:hypothetical protein
MPWFERARLVASELNIIVAILLDANCMSDESLEVRTD